MNKIPKGWTDYLPFGDAVEGTRLFPFKTPLKKEMQSNIPRVDRFTPACLMANKPNIKAVIDLTDTKTADRYYAPGDFMAENVEHLRINIPGGGVVPGVDQINRFTNAVDNFLKKYAEIPDALIGVHCTHGLNRTGYFICMYMVTRMGLKPVDAIQRFQKARGYEMQRQNYIEEIMHPGRHTLFPQSPNYRRESKAVRTVGNYSYQNSWLESRKKKPFRGFNEREIKKGCWGGTSDKEDRNQACSTRRENRGVNDGRVRTSSHSTSRENLNAPGVSWTNRDRPNSDGRNMVEPLLSEKDFPPLRVPPLARHRGGLEGSGMDLLRSDYPDSRRRRSDNQDDGRTQRDHPFGRPDRVKRRDRRGPRNNNFSCSGDSSRERRPR